MIYYIYTYAIMTYACIDLSILYYSITLLNNVKSGGLDVPVKLFN